MEELSLVDARISSRNADSMVKTDKNLLVHVLTLVHTQYFLVNNGNISKVHVE